MNTLIYAIWILLPTLFFVLGLWSWLEKKSGTRERSDAADLFRQGIFITACVIIARVIDYLWLPDIALSLGMGFFPEWFFRFFLLPVILLLAAKILGPSRAILITKAPSVSKRKPRK